MNNIYDFTSVECTGCGACAIACSYKAISLKKNNDGFYISKIDLDKCKECGQCKKVCHRFIKDDDKNSIYNSKVYMGYSRDENILKLATSGGVGYEIAKKGLREQFKVVGVEYDLLNNIAKHIIIEKEEEIDKITGSKYLQSYTVDAFRRLDLNKKYIIFGTPCQICGLRQIIKKYDKENNFILVDFFCHGVPTYNLWDKYLKYISEKCDIHKISNIQFRCKEKGWHTFLMKIQSKDEVYIEDENKDLFYKFFLSESCINNSCYNCKMRFNKIYSDIRIGDFWGDYCKKNDSGVSVILVNTELGENFFKGMKNDVYLKRVDFEEIRKVKEGNKGKKRIPNYRNIIMEELRLSHTNIYEIYKKYLYKYLQKQYIKNKIKKFIPYKIKEYIKGRSSL